MPLRARPGRNSGQSRGGRSPMIARQIGQCFAAEVEGVNMAKPLSRDDVAAIHAAMDRYAVLVFHDQHADESRRPTTSAALSTLDKNSQVFARDDRRRLFALGNRLWHSDSSFKATPAKYSLLRAVSVPSRGGNTEFAYMRAPHDALDRETTAA